jgi:Domain of unknown function (DUF397)
MAVRGSKDKTGLVLTFTPGVWGVFLRGTQNGEFDAIWLPSWLEGTSCVCDCMSSRGSFTEGRLAHRIAIEVGCRAQPAPWQAQLRAWMAMVWGSPTCVLQRSAGDPMHLGPGRTAAFIRQVLNAGSYVVCHDTLYIW